MENRPAARGLFQQELTTAFDLITSQPEIAPLAGEAESPGVRRFTLSRIRYYLYYRHGRDVVHVLALWHSSRGTGPDL